MGDYMKITNYYCNNKIYGENFQFQLKINKRKDKCFVDKRKVPTLRSIVNKLLEEKRSYDSYKELIIENFYSFLLSCGKKERKENDEVVWNEKEPYAKVLKICLNDEGFYSSNIPVQNEIDYKVDNPARFEEIVSLEKFFIDKTLKEAITKNENIRKEDIAWYSSFEKVGQFHYHLAKRQNKKNDICFISQIDLCTKDTLYYIEVRPNFSFAFVALYLNIQNIDLQKKNLKLLVVFPNGYIECFDVP